MMAREHIAPVIVALDYPSQEEAIAFVEKITPEMCQLKVGKELFTREGPEFVRRLTKQGFRVFLDLKFHDIPHTVARACAAAAELGVWMLNVHASGGLKMMQAARKELDRFGADAPLLIAVTVLTSMDESQLRGTGVTAPVGEHVSRLAALTKKAGLDGVVCSPLEVALLRKALGHDFLLVTPGIRPTGVSLDDQSRIMTPIDAMQAGSHYLVMGRPITQSPSPAETLLNINESLNEFV
ncbi:MAG: orotidine-5'-phosphate decarboxylase [Gammaproteobacteria bacterium]